MIKRLIADGIQYVLLPLSEQEPNTSSGGVVRFHLSKNESPSEIIKMGTIEEIRAFISSKFDVVEWIN